MSSLDVRAEGFRDSVASAQAMIDQARAYLARHSNLLTFEMIEYFNRDLDEKQEHLNCQKRILDREFPKK